jgi:hypothetical protein
MQVMEKEFIRCSYAEGDRLLHELVNGSFQFGAGSDADIVTDLEQVSMFPDKVQARVQAWLERDGVSQARKDKNQVLLQEQAQKSGPGVLDAMAEKLGPEMKAQLMGLIGDFLKSAGTIPEKEPETVQQLSEGRLVVNEAGNREFIPDLDEQDSIIARELEHERKLAAGEVDAPDTADSPELVGAGVAAAPGPMGEQIATARAKSVRKK